jgi:hypothetical protein
MALLTRRIGVQNATIDVTKDTILNVFTIALLTNPTTQTLTFQVFDETTKTIRASFIANPNTTTTPTMNLAVPTSYSLRAGLT